MRKVLQLMPKLKLYFIPHAGGSAMGYMTIKRFLDTEYIEPIPLEPAGRGKRMKEPLFHDVKESAFDLFEQIKKDVKENEYAFFGHSLGALLAFELAHILQQEGYPAPSHIFFSGRVQPGLPMSVDKVCHLTDEKFLDRFVQGKALPKELLDNQELLQMMLPILRADVYMAEQYQSYGYPKLGCDISVFYGNEDIMVDADEMTKWAQVTTGKCSIHSFEGDHFYFNKVREALGELISNTMIEKDRSSKGNGKNI